MKKIVKTLFESDLDKWWECEDGILCFQYAMFILQIVDEFGLINLVSSAKVDDKVKDDMLSILAVEYLGVILEALQEYLS